jgi:hypothetical protein
MSTPIIELIAANIEAAINAITVANGFNQNLVALRCKRNDFATITPGNGVVLIVQEGAEMPAQCIGTETWIQTFSLMAIVIDSDTVATSIDTRLNQVAGDIVKKLRVDWTRGGYAIDTNFDAPQLIDDPRFTGVTVAAKVEYRTKWGDPYTQG